MNAAFPRQTDPMVVRMERAGRAGKTVTVVEKLAMHPEGKLKILSHLKKVCGAGGTLKNGALEIQGDQKQRVAAALAALGYKVTVG